MDDKLFDPARYNTPSPQPGFAAVDTDNSDEHQEKDKKDALLTEKREKYDDRAKPKEQKE